MRRAGGGWSPPTTLGGSRPASGPVGARARLLWWQGARVLLAQRTVLGEARALRAHIRPRASAYGDLHSSTIGTNPQGAAAAVPGGDVTHDQHDRARARRRDRVRRRVHGARGVALLRRKTIMESASDTGRHVRFVTFELDMRTRELRTGVRRIRLQEQPFEI